MGKVVEILRLVRLFQILKVAWHYTGLWSLGATLRHSYHEVGLLLLFLFVGIPIFSVLIYFVEKDDHMSSLTSIPICWWWTTISLTTVDDGDTHRVTLVRNLIASTCIVCGILVTGSGSPHYLQQVFQKQKDADLYQCSEDPPGKCHEPSCFNIGDICAHWMHVFTIVYLLWELW